MPAASRASQRSYQIATIEVMMPATASTPRILYSAWKSSSPSTSSIRNLQAERHDDVERRLDQHAEGDDRQRLPVAAQMRPDEAEDRRHRAGGFLGGEDDEILVVIVIVDSSSSSFSLSLLSRGAAAGLRPADERLERELLRKFSIVAGAGF